MFLALVHFWWEFRLLHLHQWKFIYYIFIIFYVTPYTLLFPDNMDEYASYRDYFVSRRKWFFGLLATTSVLDIGDTLLKGREYFESFGIEYPLRNAAHFMLCLVAMKSGNLRFQAVFMASALVYQLSWILRLFETI